MALNIYSKESVDGLLATKVGEAPVDGYQYVRQNAAWAILTGGGGSATWGSISGDISTQTDLQNEFANYLLLAGGTLTGGLTVSSYGITFSDSSIMTTAPTVFNGGTVNSTVSVTDGTNTTSVTAGGIIFPDSTTQTTAFPANTFLPLSGGAMTGALTLGGDLNGGGYNLTDCNFNSSAGQVNCQNLTLTNGDGGSVTFSDGSVQTTAASGANTAGVASALAVSLVSFDGVNTWTFNVGSGMISLTVLNGGNIGVTQDAVNFYPFDSNPSPGVFQASTFTNNSSNYTYIAFKDSYGNWHWCSNGFLYTD